MCGKLRSYFSSKLVKIVVTNCIWIGNACGAIPRLFPCDVAETEAGGYGTGYHRGDQLPTVGWISGKKVHDLIKYYKIGWDYAHYYSFAEYGLLSIFTVLNLLMNSG